MARKLSKKKISGWLLLFSAIIFFQCGGHRKVASVVSGLWTEEELEIVENPDTIVDKRLIARLDSFVLNTNRTGSLGVYIWDETAGKEVYAFNADSLMSPASNMKMLTCVAALRRKGPNYTFDSKSYMRGEMDGDTLRGDIGFRFTFDPWFSSESFRQLAQTVADQGVRRLTGRIIVDMAIKEPVPYEEHWTPGDLKRARIGLLHKGEKRVLAELKYALNCAGVSFSESKVVVDVLPSDMREVGKVSTLMIHSVGRALLNSSNEHAEALLYPLGEPFTADGKYREAGIYYLNRFISKQLNINPDSVSVIHDGSGLCPENRLSPRFLVRILHFAYAHKYIYNVLRRYLPVAGRTGTLHDRMLKPEVRGKLQAKTGTLTCADGISSLSGYTVGSNGHLLLFAIIQNGMPVYDARRWQDKFCRELVE